MGKSSTRIADELYADDASLACDAIAILSKAFFWVTVEMFIVKQRAISDLGCTLSTAFAHMDSNVRQWGLHTSPQQTKLPMQVFSRKEQAGSWALCQDINLHVDF